MVIKILKENKKSYWYLLRCDTCGKEFKRKCYKEKYLCKHKYKTKKLGENQFCSLDCFSKINRGDKHYKWKGGRTTSNGYYLLTKHDHPRADKAGYVYEHRLVMENHVGRYLKSNEVVHHINGIKTDNRIENLKLYKNIQSHFFETIILKNKEIICPHCNKKIRVEDIT